MKKIFLVSITSLAILLGTFIAPVSIIPIVWSQKAEAAVHVNGYFRKNGTYVQPYYRSNPDGNPFNNWSFPGNTNPYTGKTATGNPATYLKNYYNRSSTSYTPDYSTYTLPLTTYHSCSQYGMATWNSTSNMCECMSGYVPVNNYCKSQNQVCWDKYGYASQAAIGGGCECSYGYRLNHAGTQCILRDSYCQEIDIMASWDILSNSCTCAYGWSAIGNHCVPN